MNRAYLTIVSVIILLTSMALHALALEVPQLRGRVNDYASMLSPSATKSLETRLAAFESETSNQIAILTVPSLEDETIEGYAIKVADAWKIGQKDKDNGIILILAKKERKIRIEVGKGLQGVLPDITAGQIIRGNMAPGLRSGNFDAGITAGIDAIMAATKGEFKVSASDRKPLSKKSGGGYGPFLILLLLGFFIVAAAASSSRTAGTLTGAIALPLAAKIGLGVLLWKMGILAILGGAAGFIISLLMKLWGASGGGGSGGWGGGPTIFYGGGGGSSSSDSFSGGGGDFDGGGASDDY